MPVPGRPIDGDTLVQQPLAGLVDVFNLISQVAEVATAIILLGVPVPGDLQQRTAALFCALHVVCSCQEDEGEPACLTVMAVDLYQAELVAIEVEVSSRS